MCVICLPVTLRFASVLPSSKLGEPGHRLSAESFDTPSEICSNRHVIAAEDPTVSRLIRALDQAEHSSKVQTEGLLSFINLHWMVDSNWQAAQTPIPNSLWSHCCGSGRAYRWAFRPD